MNKYICLLILKKMWDRGVAVFRIFGGRREFHGARHEEQVNKIAAFVEIEISQ